MPTETEHAKPPAFGRNSQIEALTEFLDQRLETLVDRSIEIAKSNGYAPFTTTIRAAWVEAILSVTESLGNYLDEGTTQATGPLATLDYAEDPRFARMRLIARQHRSIGITLQMYIGLFKHFRNLYLAELQRMPGGLKPAEADRVRDFFDETELSISADWTHTNDNKRLRELQERTRKITLDKDRYFAIFESLQNPAFLLDLDGNLVNANQASAELFLGRDVQAGDIIYLRSMRLGKRSLQSVINRIMETEHTSDDPVWLETLDGQRCFDIRMRTLHDAVENMALGRIVLLNDVTLHQKKTEQAQQSEQGMSRFLATMSHEIRTPLHSVLGAAELLRTADPSGAETYLDVIEGAGTALLQTLSNVLDYSKFEKEPPVSRPVETNLFEELRAFGRIAMVGRDESRSRLSFDLDPRVPKSAEIDWGMTQQVLSNLVSNSLKADSGGGVVVAVTRVSGPGDAHRLRIEVRDHGPGIPAEAAGALFRPFERATVRDTGSGGSGLGLAISHYLVEAMGGQIGYENRDTGAAVWFEIPIWDTGHKTHTGRGETEDATGVAEGTRLCLLVDDDPIGAIVTTRQLERLGLMVTRAASVAEARTYAAAAGFDVFVVDYLLPDGDGPSLVRELRETLHPAARYVAVTANVEALAEHPEVFDEILAKPVGQTSLSSAIFGSGPGDLAASIADRDRFEGLQGLAPKTVAAMIETFSEAWCDFRRNLRSVTGDQPDHELALMAHRLAGSCAVMGLVELEPSLRQLEALCLDENRQFDVAASARALDRDLEEFPTWHRLKTAWAIP